jgi:hypothetical protein
MERRIDGPFATALEQNGYRAALVKRRKSGGGSRKQCVSRAIELVERALFLEPRSARQLVARHRHLGILFDDALVHGEGGLVSQCGELDGVVARRIFSLVHGHPHRGGSAAQLSSLPPKRRTITPIRVLM